MQVYSRKGLTRVILLKYGVNCFNVYFSLFITLYRPAWGIVLDLTVLKKLSATSPKKEKKNGGERNKTAEAFEKKSYKKL